jgi:hypothetical protein
MATKTKTAEIVRNSFFAKTEKPEGIVIPEVPVFVQANCAQKGSWVLGEESLGNKELEMFILAFQFGQEYDPYKEKDIPTGTIIFTPVGSTFLKDRLVYATKIKNQASGRKGSLANFGAKVAEAVASGLDPRELIWCANFVHKSGSLPSGEVYNCSVINFSTREIADEQENTLLGHCVIVLEEDFKISNLLSASLPKFAELEAAA